MEKIDDCALDKPPALPVWGLPHILAISLETILRLPCFKSWFFSPRLGLSLVFPWEFRGYKLV